LEHYQIAISYYEYCFPGEGEGEGDKNTPQTELDALRHACLCNLSLCYLRLGSFRLAEESASLVLRNFQQQTNNTGTGTGKKLNLVESIKEKRISQNTGTAGRVAPIPLETVNNEEELEGQKVEAVDKQFVTALYRRGQARRHLDIYEYLF
jgi:hypothetical protein